jgi:hypothetical protein
LQERAHARTDWPSRIYLSHLEDELRWAEQKLYFAVPELLNKEIPEHIKKLSPELRVHDAVLLHVYPNLKMYASTDETVEDIRMLFKSKSKVKGEAVGEPVDCLGTIKVYSSRFGVGFHFTGTNATTGRTTNISVPTVLSTRAEQSQWREQPDCVGASVAIRSVIKTQRLSAKPNSYSRLNVGCTSIATVAIINNGYFPNTSSTPLRPALLLARQRQIILRAFRLPPDDSPPGNRGRNKSRADEWGLHLGQVQAILSHLQIDIGNPHLVDCMAGRSTKICKRYISPQIDPTAMYQDVLAHTFPPGILYCYPPHSMLEDIITKIVAERRTTILVAPLVRYVPLNWSKLVPYVKRAFAIPYHRSLHYAPEGDYLNCIESEGPTIDPPLYPLLVMIVTGIHWDVEYFPTDIQQLARAAAHPAPEQQVELLNLVMSPIVPRKPSAMELEAGMTLEESEDKKDMRNPAKILALARKLLTAPTPITLTTP